LTPAQPAGHLLRRRVGRVQTDLLQPENLVVLVEGRVADSADAVAVRVGLLVVVVWTAGVRVGACPEQQRDPFEVALLAVVSQGDVRLTLQVGELSAVSFEYSQGRLDTLTQRIRQRIPFSQVRASIDEGLHDLRAQESNASRIFTEATSYP